MYRPLSAGSGHLHTLRAVHQSVQCPTSINKPTVRLRMNKTHSRCHQGVLEMRYEEKEYNWIWDLIRSNPHTIQYGAVDYDRDELCGLQIRPADEYVT